MEQVELLFEFNDTENIIVGNNLDVQFNDGEVLHDFGPINWGNESIHVMLEESNLFFPKEGVYKFKANDILYQMEIKNIVDDYYSEIVSVKKL
tara:strand:- start:188 stop:466 length:279 start_codon:yes stop_codon:yes gene_type:complete